MKEYQVNFKHIEYTHATVKAESEEEAEDKARDIEANGNLEFDEGEHEVISIQEVLE